MPGDQMMDFDMMFSDGNMCERDVSVKTEVDETPIASKALITLEEFLGCEYEGDNWPKNNFLPPPSPHRDAISDSWYVASVTRDCSTENYDSDSKPSKQITIRLPLKSRLPQTIESQLHAGSKLHHPSCITPDTSEIRIEPEFPKSIKVEIPEKERLKRPCSHNNNTPEVSAKRSKDIIVKKNVAESVTKSETKNVKPPRKTRKPRTYKYDPKPLKRKDGKTNIPDALKDEEYWENRKRNNEAAKKSRVNRRTKELELVTRMGRLEDENNVLKESVEKLLKMNSKLEDELANLK